MRTPWNAARSIAGVCIALSVYPLLAVQAQSTRALIGANGARLEKLWTGGTHTEGVAVAPDGTVYFCDTTPTDMPGPLEAGHIYKWDAATGRATIFRSPSNQANGMKFDAGGRMLVAESADGGGRRVTRTDMSTGKSEIVAAQFANRPLNSVNDRSLPLCAHVAKPSYPGL